MEPTFPPRQIALTVHFPWIININTFSYVRFTILLCQDCKIAMYRTYEQALTHLIRYTNGICTYILTSQYLGWCVVNRGVWINECIIYCCKYAMCVCVWCADQRDWGCWQEQRSSSLSSSSSPFPSSSPTSSTPTFPLNTMRYYAYILCIINVLLTYSSPCNLKL